MKALLCNKTHFFSHKKIENRKELDYDIVDGMCKSVGMWLLMQSKEIEILL